MFDSFKAATTSTLGVSGKGGGSRNEAFLKTQAGTWTRMEIIILCVILKYGGDNLWSPAKAFQNIFLTL